MPKTSPKPQKAPEVNKTHAPKLTEPAKQFIVVSNARCKLQRTTIREVFERFGVEITAQTVEFYDPTKVKGRNLSAHWRALFAEERKKFYEHIEDIPLSHQSYRIGMLQSFVEDAAEAGKIGLAADMIKQAAQDLGGIFNASAAAVPSSAPPMVDLTHLEADERDQLRALLDMTDEEAS